MLDADGSVWSTGYNGYGQFGIGTADTYNVLPTQMKDTKGSILYGVKEIASGTYHTALIKEDNTVWSVGYNGGGYGILGQGKRKFIHNNNKPSKRTSRRNRWTKSRKKL